MWAPLSSLLNQLPLQPDHIFISKSCTFLHHRLKNTIPSRSILETASLPALLPLLVCLAHSVSNTHVIPIHSFHDCGPSPTPLLLVGASQSLSTTHCSQLWHYNSSPHRNQNHSLKKHGVDIIINLLNP